MLVSSRTTNILLVLVLAVGLGIVAMLATGVRGGPLDPPAPPGSTLPQVEPRSPVPPVGWNGTFPIVIDQPGSYFLTRNLTTPGGVNGINITSSNVTLDLNGFALDGTNQVGTGIDAQASVSDVRVEHGLVVRFGKGVSLTGVKPRVADVRVKTFGVGPGITMGEFGIAERCLVTGSGNGAGVDLAVGAALRDCEVLATSRDGVKAAAFSIVEGNLIAGGGLDLGQYGIHTTGIDVTIRDNILDSGAEDIGVGENGAVIIDNVIHCATSIVNLGGFSYTAPVNGVEHSNQPRYAAGFC